MQSCMIAQHLKSAELAHLMSTLDFKLFKRCRKVAAAQCSTKHLPVDAMRCKPAEDYEVPVSGILWYVLDR